MAVEPAELAEDLEVVEGVVSSPSVTITSLTSAITTVQPPRIKNFRVSKNSIDESVLTWNLEDSNQAVDSFIIIGTYFGITAPLGAVPITSSNPRRFKFADSTLSPYVGTKTYRIIMFHRDGTITMHDTSVNITRRSSIPLSFFKSEKL